MKFISSINAYLVEESDIKNGVLKIDSIKGPSLEAPRFIATDDVLKLCKKVVFGDGVTDIPEDAFYLWNIEEVEFGKNTKTIGKSAFESCLLKKVNTSNVATINEDAFLDNEQLSEVYLGKSLTTLSSGSFAQNANLKKVVIDPENTALSEIPSFCFRDDTGLETVENIKDIKLDSYAFSGCHKLKVTLPQKTIMSNGHFSIINFSKEFAFDKGAEVTILVEDYNEDLRNVVQQLKEKEIVVNAIPVSKKAVKQLFGTGLSPEETELMKAQKRLKKINSEIPKLNEEILSLQIKVNNLPAVETTPVEIGKTTIKL